MSGHSKWASIKRKKGASDAKRGALFTKLAKNITVAARNGKDPEMNPALRTAIDQAKRSNMPKENMEKAILKGAGELPGVSYDEVVYEAYGPSGVALLVECVTDNTNRTVSELRRVLGKHGGSLATSGSVKYLFDQKGVVRIAAEDLAGRNLEDIELVAIDAGADDIQSQQEGATITVPREQFHQLLQTLESEHVTLVSAALEWVAKNPATLSESEEEKCQTLVEVLEENEDVNAVYTNSAE